MLLLLLLLLFLRLRVWLLFFLSWSFFHHRDFLLRPWPLNYWHLFRSLPLLIAKLLIDVSPSPVNHILILLLILERLHILKRLLLELLQVFVIILAHPGEVSGQVH